MRTIIDADPFLQLNDDASWRERGLWPCSWIGCPDAGPPPFVAVYRLQFTIERGATVRVHVAADERYELYLDGTRIGRGSEQGAPDCWFFESYDLAFDAGEHSLVARVWALGPRAALAQMSLRPGFLLAAEGRWLAILGSGLARWEAMRLGGYEFVNPAPAHWRGANIRLDGAAYPWGVEYGDGDGWQPATIGERAVGRRSIGVAAAPLAAACHPAADGQPSAGRLRRAAGGGCSLGRYALDRGQHCPAAAGCRGVERLLHERGTVVLPPRTSCRAIVNLENYYCAYPELITSGGASSTVRVLWAKSLFREPKPFGGSKGNRDEVRASTSSASGIRFCRTADGSGASARYGGRPAAISRSSWRPAASR